MRPFDTCSQSKPDTNKPVKQLSPVVSSGRGYCPDSNEMRWENCVPVKP